MGLSERRRQGVFGVSHTATTASQADMNLASNQHFSPQVRRPKGYILGYLSLFLLFSDSGAILSGFNKNNVSLNINRLSSDGVEIRHQVLTESERSLVSFTFFPPPFPILRLLLFNHETFSFELEAGCLCATAPSAPASPVCWLWRQPRQAAMNRHAELEINHTEGRRLTRELPVSWTSRRHRKAGEEQGGNVRSTIC